MNMPIHKSHLKDKRIKRYFKKLQKLSLEMRKSEGNFFGMNLNSFKNISQRGGK